MSEKIGRHELDMRWQVLLNHAKLLPEFNASWPIEEQKLWYKSHRTAIKTALYLASLEDKLETEQRWEGKNT